MRHCLLTSHPGASERLVAVAALLLAAATSAESLGEASLQQDEGLRQSFGIPAAERDVSTGDLLVQALNPERPAWTRHAFRLRAQKMSEAELTAVEDQALDLLGRAGDGEPRAAALRATFLALPGRSAVRIGAQVALDSDTHAVREAFVMSFAGTPGEYPEAADALYALAQRPAQPSTRSGEARHQAVMALGQCGHAGARLLEAGTGEPVQRSCGLRAFGLSGGA